MNKNADQKNVFLNDLGMRVRSLRAELAMTRKALAKASGVSERHLANLESGAGNVSVLVLLDLAKALSVTVVELMSVNVPRGAVGAAKPVVQAPPVYVSGKSLELKRQRIALIGLRGAGKSTLGLQLAKALNLEFVEVSRVIEQLAGTDIAEIHNLYGIDGYRRLERQALKDIIARKTPVLIATPGGVVEHPDTYDMLLRHCTTVWLKAKPLDHLSRVRVQGDNRPMASTKTTQRAAIDDLKAILVRRDPEYARAEIHFDTSQFDQATCLEKLRSKLQLV